MPFERDPNELGVLWKKTGRRGEYFTGKIGDQGVVVFATNSTNAKAPTHRILKAQPKQDSADQRVKDDADDF